MALHAPQLKQTYDNSQGTCAQGGPPAQAAGVHLLLGCSSMSNKGWEIFVKPVCRAMVKPCWVLGYKLFSLCLALGHGPMHAQL